jgi:hypothetical protein
MEGLLFPEEWLSETESCFLVKVSRIPAQIGASDGLGQLACPGFDPTAVDGKNQHQV